MSRRNILLCAGAMLALTAMQAETLTPTEALLRAQSALPREAKAANSALAQSKASVLVYTLEDSLTAEPSVYAFNQDAAQGGWLIVSADDRAMPLLGYSDSGALDTDNLPPAFVALMQQYQSEIKYARRFRTPANGDYPLGFGRPYRPAIEPLLTTKWNQSEPYNNMCPTISGKATYTGCGATAMAQVMNYHEWPDQGRNTVTYDWDNNNSSLTLDFSTLTFDWAHMKDTYDTYTTQEANAVATLMKACGYGSQMNYGTDASGAATYNTTAAYVNYFNYSKKVDMVYRNNYTLLEWENLIYDQLANCGPVQYTGYNDGRSGHSFVCDGCKANRMFHINWGWGGQSDGYFLFSALDPTTQGIGGSAAGYTIGTEAIINTTAPTADEADYTYYPYICCGGTYYTAEVTSSNYLRLNGRFTNAGRTDFTGKILFDAENIADGSVTALNYSSISELPPLYAYTSRSTSISQLPAGRYKIKLYYQAQGQPQRQPLRFSGLQENYVLLVKNTDGTAAATIPLRNNISVTDVDFNTGFYASSKFNCTLKLHSDGRQVSYGYIAPCFYSAATNAPVMQGEPIPMEVMPTATPSDRVAEAASILCDIYPGDNEIDYTGTLPSSLAAGSYYLQFEEVLGQSINGDTTHIPISARLPITVQAKPATPKLCCTTNRDQANNSVTVNNPNNVDWYGITINYAIKNTQGTFVDNLEFGLYKVTRSSGSTSFSHLVSFYSPIVTINAGQTKSGTLHVEYPEGQPNTEYAIVPYGKSENTSRQLTYPVYITTNGTTGVEDVSTESPVTDSELYDLQGRRLSSAPSAGLYLRRDRHADGTVTTHRQVAR